MAGDLKGKEDEKLPPGFRFHPTDEELITYYLINKINDSNFTERAIADVDLNKCEPWDLPGKAKMGVKEWYFFSLRDRKYPTGVRTNRATNSGYWKTTGKDREIYNSQTSELVGMKKTLVFYRGRAPRGEKTNWVMHEYRIHAKSSYRTTAIAAAKDEWVVCRVIQKSGGVKKYTSSSSHSRAMNPYNLEIGQSNSQLMMMQQQQQQQEADHAYHQLQTMGRNYMMSESEMEQLSRVFRVGVGIGGTNGLNLPIHNNSQLNYSHHLGNGAEAAAFTISGLNLNLSGCGGGGGANMAPPAPIPPPPGINNQHVVGSSMLTSGGIANEGAGGGGYVSTADQQINNANAMNGRSYEGMIQCADLDAYWAAY